MKITFLVENATSKTNSRLCSSEWGFSAYIETSEGNYLFDTGHTDIYWKNAEKLGIDLNNTDIVLLSHRHWDHVKGLLSHKFKTKKKIITHPETISEADDGVEDIVRRDFDFRPSSGVCEFAPGHFYLGEIPLTVSWEKGVYNEEHLKDDSALAFKTKNGCVVVTGCSHAGISNICEYAKKVTGQDLYAVMGGFHLFEKDSESVDGALEYFKKEKPVHFYPMHCIDFPTMARFYNEFKMPKLGAGDILELDE